jgi:hypothetical protein
MMRPCIGHWVRLSVIALALGPAAIAVASSSASPSPPQSPVAFVLSASVTADELSYGAELTVTGRLTQVGQGVGAAPLTLQADPYPFHGFATVAHTVSGPDGTFTFVRVRPDRNTRLRVVLEDSPGLASPVLAVTVDPTAAINARTLGPGITRLSLRVHHTPYRRSASVSAWWFMAARGTHVFRLVAVTATRELSPELTYASATVDPPSKRFVYRVCLNPIWEHAMGPLTTHRSCPRNDFAVAHDVG